ncbi:hypothetical protein CKM354_001000800 [Cercospora kikuchii]|uniref:Non-reducing polyketide synthase CTB1 n=1 Tax=Cercospora kikuchii TaxID=84275 RepID=A0A9P3CPE1_9PEZI|nr:uncharacterized protein CKM354_001000800 [Cercospora kikuchii]GIZ46902.1 hypothetical protein CKM354_001000800 [Cercospora kikuchii]
MTKHDAKDDMPVEGVMGLAYFSNEFPPDDIATVLRNIRFLAQDRRHPLLESFLVKATEAVRKEIQHLPGELRNAFPAFPCITSLWGEHELRQGSLSGAIDGSLLCVVQLGIYISAFETGASRGQGDIRQQPLLAGLGIGLLVSSAVALSSTLYDLPARGSEIVRIAFRLGTFVADTSKLLEPVNQDVLPESWAYVVHGVSSGDAQMELDVLHARKSTPKSAHIFISAKSRTSVTISGPPARLKALFRTSAFFRDRKHAALPVYAGLCHANHLYSVDDAKAIVHSEAQSSLWLPVSEVLSTSTGKAFVASNGAELLEQIVFEILTKAIVWENVVQGFLERVKHTSVAPIEIQVSRASLPSNELVQTLEKTVSPSRIKVVDLVTAFEGELLHHSHEPGRASQSKIAVVGMACRMPGGANDTDALWDILEKGYDLHKKIPADRFDVDSHTDTSGVNVNASHTPYGCFIDEPGLFDAAFFNISPKEAEQIDPMQRLALVTAYEALERAGYVANRTSASHQSRVGVYYGQASDDYREVNTAQEIGTYFIPGGCRAFGPGRINYFFKFSGPSFSCDTACSSSLATVQMACTALWSGDVDTVVAGGVNVLTNSDAFAGLSKGHFLTKTPNACKTWDTDADGYCRADAIGSIVLKRLEDAERDNDNILGVILGAATNHSAHAVSITHPHAGHQADLYHQVLGKAGVDPLDVDYIEMHGTGTQAGDFEEMKSVSDVFAPNTRRRHVDRPLHVGALKSNIGHSEAAAGVSALLKVLLMFQKGQIPRHIGIKNGMNSRLPKDMDRRNLRIPLTQVPWATTDGRKRTAVVNSFSAAGGNTTLLLEEGTRPKHSDQDPRPSHVVTVSAKGRASFKGNLERLLQYLTAYPECSIADLAYSLTARKSHYNYRFAVEVSHKGALESSLRSAIDSADTKRSISTVRPPAVAFAFTGQGSMDPSSNLEMYEHSPTFRSEIDRLDGIAQRQGFQSFISSIDGSHPKDYTHTPVVTQLAILCVELALTRYWGDLGVKPDLVIGHSLGEYAALCVSGVLSPSDAIFLVGTRALMLEEKCTVGSHAMLAVKMSVSEIEDSTAGLQLQYEFACINGPDATTISGSTDDISEVYKVLHEKGFRCVRLDVAFAFHSAQTDPILDNFELAAQGVVFNNPRLPVLSPLLARAVCDDKSINAGYLRRATRETCNFAGALQKAKAQSFIDDDTVWLEIGPHTVCTSFIRSTVPSTKLTIGSLQRGENNWTTISRALASLYTVGISIRWPEFHRSFEGHLRLLDLPTYSWNNKNFWIQYNGDWALTKGNTFYDNKKANDPVSSVSVAPFQTSTIQHLIEQTVDGSSAKVIIQSDLMQQDFLAAANGHRMNNCGVVTSSIHADIAYTLGKHLHSLFYPDAPAPDMDIAHLEVTKGLVANSNPNSKQLIQVEARTDDIRSRVVHLAWYNVDNNEVLGDSPFAIADIIYGNAQDWLVSWLPLTHMIEGRIQTLEQLAQCGSANRLSRTMAYALFANNLVDYENKYRGMQTVVMNEFEAFADVELVKERSGTWTVPPYWIDSVAHLAGFVMNVSDASDTAKTYCVTPGWQSMRFARPFVAGGKYRSYVKMIPTVEDPTMYLGDVYVLQEGVVIGMVGGIQFRRFPRILLSHFFSPPDFNNASAPAPHERTTPTKTVAGRTVAAPKVAARTKAVEAKPVQSLVVDLVKEDVLHSLTPNKTTEVVDAVNKQISQANSTAMEAVALIALEAGLELEDLPDEASFSDIGVDSLLSLVVSEKFRQQLGIQAGSSLFLEYPTVGALKSWLEEYYG